MGDAYYACKTVGLGILSDGNHIVTRVRNNAVAYQCAKIPNKKHPGRPKVYGKKVKLKSIFKGAATTVIGQARKDCPLYQHYAAMLHNKTKPNLAKLTLARQIAAITLALWKKEARYDPAKLTKQR